jgi:hypothetical protein
VPSFVASVLTVLTLALAGGFDLYAIPATPPGDRAWVLSGYCARADVPRTRRLVEGTKRFISAGRDGRVRRMMVAPSIWATYEPWGSSYAMVFELAHPRDVIWIATCLRVAGADLQSAGRHQLHVRADRPPVDLEYAPEVGFYYVVR